MIIFFGDLFLLFVLKKKEGKKRLWIIRNVKNNNNVKKIQLEWLLLLLIINKQVPYFKFWFFNQIASPHVIKRKVTKGCFFCFSFSNWVQKSEVFCTRVEHCITLERFDDLLQYICAAFFILSLRNLSYAVYVWYFFIN